MDHENLDAWFDRFLDAQDRVMPDVLDELARGRKRTHWIWFVFPQLTRLGRSETARWFGIDNLERAERYLAHPVLGARLRECTKTVLRHRRPAAEILGDVDAMKLRSSMTLFAHATETNDVFVQALRQFFEGSADPLTSALLHTDDDASDCPICSKAPPAA